MYNAVGIDASKGKCTVTVIQPAGTLMAIVSLFESLLNDIFTAEQNFFENPGSFDELETSVKSSTEAFAAAFLGEILSELDRAIYRSTWRKERYSVHRRDKGFSHLIETLIGLERNERFTTVAEAALLAEALKTSFV